MTGRELFVAATRIFGLWVGYSGISQGMAIVIQMVGFAEKTREIYPPGAYLVTAVWELFFAAFLLFRTETFARMVCGDGESPPPLADS